MSEFLGNFIDLLISALSLAIFGRVILSWILPKANDPFSKFLQQITEPILQPIRQFVPPMGMFDLTPMIALLVLNVLIRPVVLSLL